MKSTSRWGPKILINFSDINNKTKLRSKKALVFDIKSVHGIMINFKKFIYVENVNVKITKHVL